MYIYTYTHRHVYIHTYSPKHSFVSMASKYVLILCGAQLYGGATNIHITFTVDQQTIEP